MKSYQPLLDATLHLRVNYVDSTNLPQWLATLATPPMAIVSFGAPVPTAVSCPVITLDLPQLDGRPLLEVWTNNQPVTVHRINEFFAATSGEMLVGILQLEEAPAVGLQQTIGQAYRRLLRHVQEIGYPYLWRIWNFFPGLNETEAGLERYRQFCAGRHQALSETLQGFPCSLPAGTAVGTRSGPLQLYVLAGTHPAIHLGNPRQVHAYEYPEQYGPRSPSFARATLLKSESHARLFIAGTASVTGHESRHAGLPKAQVLEVVNNLNALIAHAYERWKTARSHPPLCSQYKVYIRQPDHLRAVQQALGSSLLASSQTIYLQGDICRKELLVEIEGMITMD